MLGGRSGLAWGKGMFSLCWLNLTSVGVTYRPPTLAQLLTQHTLYWCKSALWHFHYSVGLMRWHTNFNGDFELHPNHLMVKLQQRSQHALYYINLSWWVTWHGSHFYFFCVTFTKTNLFLKSVMVLRFFVFFKNKKEYFIKILKYRYHLWQWCWNSIK